MSLKIDYLTITDLIKIGERLIPDFRIRDIGLLESAVARPQITVFGDDAYVSFEEKTAALMHSIVKNPALIDGNKRLAWTATRTFCRLNGYDLCLSVDEAEEVVLSATSGKFDVDALSKTLKIRTIE